MLLLRLLKRNVLWLLLLPALTAATVYYFTRNLPKVYRSTATIYTGLASGYSILSDEQNSWVSPEVVNNEFDNLFTTINSQETMMRVGTRLLSRHLQLKNYDSLILGRQGYRQLEQIKAKISKYVVNGEDETATYLRLDGLAHAKGINPVKTLLLQGGTYYSVGRIKNVKTVRKSGSDMLLMEYESDDPAITQATLALLIEVFRERYANFKSSEANSVVKYYTDRTRNTQNSLQQAETKLKSFGVTNKIVDYGQQTITAATSKAALTNDYNQEMMQYQAAKAAMATLGKRVSDRSSAIANNEAFINKREEIVKVQTQLANARSYGQPKSVIADLETKLNRLTSDMKSVALQHYEFGNTTESVAQRTLVDEWLKKVMTYEESAARLGVYEKQIKELDNTTNQLAPLGSTLKQLNRDVDVAEKEYMENLAELNKARVRQKNAEMEGPLSVLDEPDFPMAPLASKRKMLVGAGLATGLVLALLLMLVRYMLDNRVTSPQHAETQTGFLMVASFPVVGKRSAKALRTAQAMLEQLRSTIAIELKAQTLKLPYTVVTLVSNRPKQGKSWISMRLAEQYAQAGHTVAYLYPQLAKDQPAEVPNVTFISYAVGSDFIDVPDVDTLMKRNANVDAAPYDLILLELPSLINHAIPTHLVGQTNVSVFVVNAKAVWTREDAQLTALYKRAATHSVIAVLNQVDLSMVAVPPVLERAFSPASSAPQPKVMPLPEPVKTA
ncbi:GumC family protein [Spirosoma validum]|uniref:Lipopolysaccharide biosynthesis protein n=1 Tax=Spirosoma validum TaxID=2771355 RepID=A0A927B6T3_9BACT|nr:GNVR domain-containing protein [Spirosoma validum]MBD2756222.1 lipopolysaccharide biosynthesis protein [Spirosoma validum]